MKITVFSRSVRDRWQRGEINFNCIIKKSRAQRGGADDKIMAAGLDIANYSVLFIRYIHVVRQRIFSRLTLKGPATGPQTVYFRARQKKLDTKRGHNAP